MTEDNNPEIILKLVARSHRACIAWVDPHNESFYLPPLLEVTNKDLQEAVVHPDGTSRQPTPSSEDVMASEPALQINFRKKPKNPEKGYVLGSDRKSCDILLGEVDDCISNQMFILSFNQYNDVVMKSSAKNATMVRYDTKIDSQIDTQIAKRTNFTWIFPPGQEKLSVRIARTIEFSVEVPIHETDKIAYETNCRNFMVQAKSAMVTMNRLDLSSRPETNLASGMKSPHATAEPPFYLRTEKIGKGGFGMVYRARSMPSGETVALKTFKSKNAWTLEIDVLRKLFKTPHDNIVKFIDFGMGDKPFLAMGLALGGTLEQQHKFMPFTIRETALILRQMLEALVYLHDDFGITHRDIKPANILCDSRTHCRLADFGLAKEGDVLKTVKGTRPYMAPEMFVRKPYTCKVDLWALGMVIAELLSRSWPPGYRGIEGERWCAAVVTHFERYQQRFEANGSPSFEQSGLNFLVGQYMLRMNAEDRESALTCLGIGNQMSWWRSDDASYNGAKTPTQENPTESVSNTPSELNGALEWWEEEGSPEDEVNGPSGMNESLGDDDSEADTEIPEAQSLNSDDWLSLERQFPIEQANGGGNGLSGLQKLVHSPSVNHKGAEYRQKRTSYGTRPASPAAPIGVKKPVHKRQKSSLAKSVAAGAARQAGVGQSQSGSKVISVGEELSQNASQFTSTGEEISQGDAEPAAMDEEEWSQGEPNTISTDEMEELLQGRGESALEDGYRPGQPGYLDNPENLALFGAGETLDNWIMGRGSWPGET